MLSTIIVVALFLGLLIVSVILWAVFLRLGLRWAKVPDVTTRRIVLAAATVIVLQIVLDVLFRLPSPSSEARAILLAVAELAAAVLVPCLVIARVFKTRFLRSLQAWLPALLPSVVMILFVFLVLRPFLYEAFVSPTNAMAPTLLGNHWRGVCPECGQPSFCSPVHDQFGPPDPPRMICENFHVTQVLDVDKRVFSADRFLVAKFLTPRRWDIVVFQYPEDSSTLYVMRLVGLPGEKIRIEGGAVWANGKKLTPPDSLHGIEYLSQLPDWYSELWGSANRPAILGEHEYFVLGDFSPQSKDSRLWEQGAPGHHPFAVPESHLYGVVTHIYWPPQRWRNLR
ncbi:MAG: signal peptidase I [Planctomycetota bacterium]|jgi:signal peptidase I